MSEAFALDPRVLDFRAGPCHLRSELARLEAVRQAGAYEAGVFYAARILEVTTLFTLQDLELDASYNTFHNLAVMESVGLLAGADIYTGYALRQLGNAARHVLAPVAGPDLDAGLSFLAGWLDWFFVRRPTGPRLISVTDGGEPWRPARTRAGRLVAVVLDQIADEGAPTQGVVEDVIDGAGTASVSQRTLLALVAESLVESGALARAREFLRRARELAPTDPRLREIEALRLRRQGDHSAAIDLLAPHVEGGHGDEESVGILAAALKARAEAEARGEDMVRAHELYRRAWRRSQHRNTWLGVNAATTALFLGRHDVARTHAAKVRTILEERERVLLRRAGTAATLPYYFQASLAEALLLEGDEEGARRRYRIAIATHHGLAGAKGSTAQQASRILDQQGRARSFQEWLGTTPTGTHSVEEDL